MNENANNLDTLIEQAAAVAKQADPGEINSLRGLESIIEKIKQNASEYTKDSQQLREQIQGLSAKAAQTLQQILTQQNENISDDINRLSQTFEELHSLSRQVRHNADSQKEQTKEPEKHEQQNHKQQKNDEQLQQINISDEDASLVGDFITEAHEHIESAEAGLLELESKPADSETLNQIFRAFHTIKGMAGFLNLLNFNSLAHSAENVLDLARKNEINLTGENINIIFETIDILKNMLASLKQCIQNPPPRTWTPDQRCKTLESRLEIFAENRGVKANDNQPEKSRQDKYLDDTLKEQTEPQKTETAGGERRSGGDRRTTPDRRKAAAETIKVNTARLDSLIDMTGELVIAQLMVTEATSKNLAADHQVTNKVTHLSKIVREIQELSMSMRMVPIRGAFQKMARLVRDLSRKAGKKVNLTTAGEDTELDRNIVDKIADPLVHMVRNSVDHGIETPQKRQKAGKIPAGNVHLRAFHQAGNIVIEIEDDGKGLNKERIIEKAVKTGLIEPGTELTDEQAYKLVFHAGLSTAEKITDVSGRGVGMDVVKKNIEKLRGKVDIASTPGKGTTFSIRLPLTLAIIEGQIVEVGNQRYIIPINSIEHSLRPTKQQISSVQNKGEMINIRGRLVPLVRLYKLFEGKPKTEDPTKALVVVVEEDKKRCCLLVDDLLNQQQVVIKSLGNTLGRIRGVSGGAIMGDGKVSLILDVPGLIELARD